MFLTATPMYDTPTEIIWMINVLIRVNGDTCDELVEKDIFNETQGFTLKKSGLSKFIRNSWKSEFFEIRKSFYISVEIT